MQLSKKAEYAVRAVTILSAQGTDVSMQAQELAQTGDIPQKFLEQILLILRRSSLITSKRGVGGGYRIAKEPRLVTVEEVILAIEGEIAPFPESESSTDFPGASGIEDCFNTATNAYKTILENTTIEDLLNHQSGENMVGFGI